MGKSSVLEGHEVWLAPDWCIGGRRTLLFWHLLVKSNIGALGDPSDCSGGIFHDDTFTPVSCGATRRIRCERDCLLVELVAVPLLLVRGVRSRSGVGAIALGARVVLHNLCACVLVRHRLVWGVRGCVHLLEDS